MNYACFVNPTAASRVTRVLRLIISYTAIHEPCMAWNSMASAGVSVVNATLGMTSTGISTLLTFMTSCRTRVPPPLLSEYSKYVIAQPHLICSLRKGTALLLGERACRGKPCPGFYMLNPAIDKPQGLELACRIGFLHFPQRKGQIKTWYSGQRKAVFTDRLHPSTREGIESLAGLNFRVGDTQHIARQ